MPDRSSAFSMRLVGAWTGVLVFGALLSIYPLSFPLNRDVGWWLYVADSVLNGADLYTDLLEINPPLYGYLLMAPLGLAKLAGVSEVLAARGFVMVVSAAGILAAGMVAGLQSEGRYRAPLVAFALAAAIFGFTGIEFGEREHLMFVLVAPYLLLRSKRGSARDVPTAIAVGVGLAAAIGFSLKPHFVLLWGALEVAFWMRDGRESRSWLRPEMVTVTLFILAYGVFVASVHPEYLRLLLETAPLYGQFAVVERIDLATGPYTILLVTVVAAFLLAGRPYEDLGTSLLIFAVLAWVMAIGQGKGWMYHFFPSVAALVSVGILTLVGIGVRYGGTGGLARRVSFGLAGGLCVLVGTLFATAHVRSNVVAGNELRVAVSAQSGVLDRWEAESMVVLSTSVNGGFPTVNYSSNNWASPYSGLWWVQAAHGQNSIDTVPTVRSEAELSLREALVEALVDAPPDVVFVARREPRRFVASSFPYVAYLSQDSRFRELWKAYRRRGMLGRYRVFVHEDRDREQVTFARGQTARVSITNW